MIMEEIFIKWIGTIIPWLLGHVLKILIIAVAAWLLNKIISRIIRKAVRVAAI